MSAAALPSTTAPPLPEAAARGERATRPISIRERPLVSAAWLAERASCVTIIDTRPQHHFDQGHIERALSLPIGAYLIDDVSPAHLDGLQLLVQDALGMRGIAQDSELVFVDDGDGSAALGALLAELAGASSARALHGGLRSWLACGHTLTDAVATLDPTPWTAPDRAAVDHVARIEDVCDATSGHSDQRAHRHVIDVRSQLEHEGIIGASCCGRRGHVPGSVHLEWSSLVDPTGALVSGRRVCDMLDDLDIELTDEIIVFCHGNLRAATASLALRTAGCTNVRVYLGSIHEWIAQDRSVSPADDLA